MSIYGGNYTDSEYNSLDLVYKIYILVYVENREKSKDWRLLDDEFITINMQIFITKDWNYIKYERQWKWNGKI